MTDLRTAAEQALEALTESVDLVQHAYDSDWRHGMPTRAAQLAAMKDGLDAHHAAIEALRAALAAAPPQVQPEWSCHCDEQGIGTPGVTCGDCPRDYGHKVKPPQVQPQPLTDEQIKAMVLAVVYEGDATTPHRDSWAAEIGIPFARAIERRHGISQQEKP
jgi:hypothetical protein